MNIVGILLGSCVIQRGARYFDLVQSSGYDCYICKKSGHRVKNCPDKYKNGSKTSICFRCGDSRHDIILCKYEYSHDDLKDIQCHVCKRVGHLCCVEPGNSPLWVVSCYRCGQLGHIGLVSCYDFAFGSSTPYYEESTEENSVSSCFRCGEEGHFSRECPNSSSIRTSHGRDSPKNLEHNSTPHESNRETKKKKNKETSEHYSPPRESNGKMKKKTHKGEHGEHPQTTPQKPKLRGGWMIDDLEDHFIQRGNIRRPRSPITPSGHNHHRLPTTYMGHTHNHRSPIFSYGGHYPGSQSTTPYGRKHRNSSYESSGHLSDHPHSRWQPHYPSSSHHHQNHRYAHAPSRYGPVHHCSEFPENYGRW
ncbi:hypothetical protein EUTSA_v10023543mg [Eutrema salsugineum]|uniref:CCHC-type domain-containing protein n=1 Tax=Eutrema salsugineum TaxID=72664 RepID=V4MCT2_EUTSA|nr:hypothetical protein EUTSA_v10023543mg [Eutrema salsugineum]